MTKATTKPKPFTPPPAELARLLELDIGERAEVRVVKKDQPIFVMGEWEFPEPQEANPFGAPGTRLWCKEKWAVSVCYDSYDSVTCHCCYGNPPGSPACAYEDVDPYEFDERGKWRAASTMPQWASRLHLTTVECRVEQVDGVWWWVGVVEVGERGRA